MRGPAVSQDEQGNTVVDDGSSPQPSLGSNLSPRPNQPLVGQDFDPTALHQQWQEWMGKPNNRAAMIQFGIAMLQPVSPGENFLSHGANALGSAGEAHQRVTTNEQQARKSDTEAELRTARAGQAESAASAAESRARSASEGLDLRRESVDNRKTIGLLSAQIQARAKYDTYVRTTEKANSDNRLLDPKAKTRDVMSFEDWFRSGGAIQGSVPSAEGSEAPPLAVTPATTPTTAPTKPTSQQILAKPEYSNAIQQIRTLANSGDPEQKRRARSLADQIFMGKVQDIETLYSQIGVK